MGERSDCPYVTDDDVVPRYLRADLDPAAAEAFEAHHFACERCWGEVEAAVAIQAAAGGRARPSKASRRPTARRRVLLAAAASLAVAAAVLFPSSTRRDPVWRSMPRGSFTVSVAQTEHAFQVTWPAIEGALIYRVDVMNAEGAVLTSQQSRSTRVEIPKSALDRSTSPPLYLRVQALEAPGKAVASAIETLDFVRR